MQRSVAFAKREIEADGRDEPEEGQSGLRFRLLRRGRIRLRRRRMTDFGVFVQARECCTPLM